MSPLQLVPYDLLPSFGTVLVLALALVATVLSGFISYQAYRGYRRNESRSMLWLAVGFAFITVLPFFVEIVGFAVLGRYVSARVAGVLLPATRYSIQIVGLGFVLYSLYGRRRVDDGGPRATGDSDD